LRPDRSQTTVRDPAELRYVSVMCVRLLGLEIYERSVCCHPSVEANNDGDLGVSAQTVR